jgi:hypothetical protein
MNEWFECPCRVKIQHAGSVHRHVRRCETCRDFVLRNGNGVIDFNNTEGSCLEASASQEERSLLKVKKRVLREVDCSNDCQGKCVQVYLA